MKALHYALVAMIAGAAPAHSADVIVDPARFETGNYSWTGFYAGVSLGQSHAQDDDPRPLFGPLAPNPFFSEGTNDQFGFHVGVMQQTGSFVFGVEYEYANLDLQYVSPLIGPLPVWVTDTHTGIGRLGIAMDRVQVYGLAGATWADTNVALDDWMPTWGFGMDVAVTDHLILGGRFDASSFEDFDDTGIEGDRSRWSVRASLKF